MTNLAKARNSLCGPAALAAAACLAPASGQAQSGRSFDTTVVRTTYGIPHISARDYGSLGYGVGYTAGQDNVCVIAEQAVTVRGDRAEFFGGERSDRSRAQPRTSKATSTRE